MFFISFQVCSHYYFFTYFSCFFSLLSSGILFICVSVCWRDPMDCRCSVYFLLSSLYPIFIAKNKWVAVHPTKKLLHSFFFLWGTIHSHFFTCSVIFCWKLDILNNRMWRFWKSYPSKPLVNIKRSEKVDSGHFWQCSWFCRRKDFWWSLFCHSHRQHLTVMAEALEIALWSQCSQWEQQGPNRPGAGRSCHSPDQKSWRP